MPMHVANVIVLEDQDGNKSDTQGKTIKAETIAVQSTRNTSMTEREPRRGELLLSDLNPDFDGDGRISAFEKEVYDMFKAADKDGSGALNMREVYGVVKTSAQLRRTASLLKKLLALSAAVIVLLTACIGGMTAVLLDAYKDTTASGAMLASRTGLIMQTSPAETHLPLLVAPVLPASRLSQIHSLTVSYVDDSYLSSSQIAAVTDCLTRHDREAISFTKDCGMEDPRITLSARVSHSLRVNRTAVIFTLDSPTALEVRVWNGFATLEKLGGGSYELCASEVTCAALSLRWRSVERRRPRRRGRGGSSPCRL